MNEFVIEMFFCPICKIKLILEDETSNKNIHLKNHKSDYGKVVLFFFYIKLSTKKISIFDSMDLPFSTSPCCSLLFKQVLESVL